MKLTNGKLNITLDGQFGSTGKGVLNGYLAEHNKVDLAISNAAPNAGHTFDIGQGKKVAFHLPISGIINSNALIYLCAGAIIEPKLLQKEMEMFGCEDRVIIHPRAAILLEEHGQREKGIDSGTTKLASTQKGVGAALSDKITRKDGVVLARDYFPERMVDIPDIDGYFARKGMVLMEVPQGYGLSLNHGLSYPHCTSRDITVASAMNDAGVHPSFLGKVIVSMRTLPIRVGNIVDEHDNELGNSGPFWYDSDEKNWEVLGLEPELTTVTKRVRRVATFSYLQYRDMLRHLRPDAVFINFVNYFKKEYELRELLIRMLTSEGQTGVDPCKLFGIGPKCSDVYESAGVVKSILWPND